MFSSIGETTYYADCVRKVFSSLQLNQPGYSVRTSQFSVLVVVPVSSITQSSFPSYLSVTLLNCFLNKDDLYYLPSQWTPELSLQ